MTDHERGEQTNGGLKRPVPVRTQQQLRKNIDAAREFLKKKTSVAELGSAKSGPLSNIVSEVKSPEVNLDTSPKGSIPNAVEPALPAVTAAQEVPSAKAIPKSSLRPYEKLVSAEQCLPYASRHDPATKASREVAVAAFDPLRHALENSLLLSPTVTEGAQSGQTESLQAYIDGAKHISEADFAERVKSVRAGPLSKYSAFAVKLA